MLLERDISALTSAAIKASVPLDSDAVRWFVAELTDLNPEEESPFLDHLSDVVWIRLLAGNPYGKGAAR